MNDCYACNLSNGIEKLPGGLVAGTEYWRIEHCTGPLGVGTLIVKPVRHVLHVWALSEEETQEMGQLLRETSRVIQELTHCDQTYICLWSHSGWKPVHIHFVVQPVREVQQSEHSHPGPTLQSEMFLRNEPVKETEVVAFCENARRIFNV